MTEGETVGPREPDKKAREQVREEAKDAQDQVKIVGSGWSTVAVAKASVTGLPAARRSWRASSAS